MREIDADERETCNYNGQQEQQQRIAPWRLALKSFSSQWFLIPQGTGILSVMLHQIHYQFPGLTRISQVGWVLTIIMLLGFLLIYLLRAILYPKHVSKQIVTNVMETSCLSSISIAFTTIIIMIAINFGKSWRIASYVLWWINTVMAVLCCVGIPYVITRMEAPGVDAVPPGILLPLIAALTAAAGGAVICRYADLDADLQVPIIIVSYLLLGMGLPTSLIVEAVVLVRLLDKAFPMHTKVYQLMILCGPPGQAAFALLLLGQDVQRGAFAKYGASEFLGPQGAASIATASQLAGLLTWGYGIFMWAYACIAIVHQLVKSPKDVLKWDQTLVIWSMIFPWGVFTNAAIEAGVILNSKAFWVISTILTICLVLLWLVEIAVTLFGVAKGVLLGLDRGWKADYYLAGAEHRKEDGVDQQDASDTRKRTKEEDLVNGVSDSHDSRLRLRNS